MSWIAVGVAVVSLVGTGVTVYGQQQQKKAVQAQADYNEKVAQQEASRTAEVAQQNAIRVEKEKNRTLARLAAANARNGISSEGTPLAVLGDVATDFEQEIADIGYGASDRRLALLSQASLGQWSADQKKSALTLNQIGTGISGVSSAGKGYLTSTGQVSSGRAT